MPSRRSESECSTNIKLLHPIMTKIASFNFALFRCVSEWVLRVGILILSRCKCCLQKNSQFQYFFLVESSIHSQTSRRPKSSMATDFAEICSPFVAIGHHIDVNFRKVFGSNLFIYTRAEKICLRFAMQLYISDLFSSNNFFFFRLLDLHPSLIVCHLPQH